MTIFFLIMAKKGKFRAWELFSKISHASQKQLKLFTHLTTMLIRYFITTVNSTKSTNIDKFMIFATHAFNSTLWRLNILTSIDTTNFVEFMILNSNPETDLN